MNPDVCFSSILSLTRKQDEIFVPFTKISGLTFSGSKLSRLRLSLLIMVLPHVWIHLWIYNDSRIKIHFINKLLAWINTFNIFWCNYQEGNRGSSFPGFPENYSTVPGTIPGDPGNLFISRNILVRLACRKHETKHFEHKRRQSLSVCLVFQNALEIYSQNSGKQNTNFRSRITRKFFLGSNVIALSSTRFLYKHQ